MNRRQALCALASLPVVASGELPFAEEVTSRIESKGVWVWPILPRYAVRVYHSETDYTEYRASTSPSRLTFNRPIPFNQGDRLALMVQ